MSPDFSTHTPNVGADLIRRRDFLKRVATVAAGSALLAEIPWWSPLRAEPAGSSAADRVRLGVIGTGSRGRFQIETMLRTPGIEIAALCDDYEPHLQRGLALVNGSPATFSDYRRMLEMPGLDGIVICTPLDQHAPMCLAALAADKSVFCEKSLAYTVEECRDVCRAATASPRVFQIGHQRLYSDAFLRAHELIKAGEIGDITQIRAYWHRNGDWRVPVPSPDLERRLNWRLYRDTSRGLMTELASHHVQVANWFLGAAPLSCVGYGSINFWKDGREVYDNVNVVYRYPGGVHLVYDSLTSNRFYGAEIQIMGPKGNVEGESGRLFSEKPPAAPGIVQLINDLEHGLFNTVPIGGPSWVPDLKKDTKGRSLADMPAGDDGSAMQMAAFANAIRQGAKIPGMIEQAYDAGVAVLIGHTAMEENREVAWPGGFAA